MIKYTLCETQELADRLRHENMIFQHGSNGMSTLTHVPSGFSIQFEGRYCKDAYILFKIEKLKERIQTPYKPLIP